MSDHVRQSEPFRWEGIEVRPYKTDGSRFSGVTRQVLFEGGDGLACQLRYFEVAPGGWSSLERHHHAHAVMIVRGGGRVLVGHRIFEAVVNDLVRVPSLTWHQFRAGANAPLGFLCVVDCERDVPEQPDAAALAELRSDPAIAEFLKA
ncbi:MAG TPA: cupin domain-containing protein [Gemmatimonadales bacterium]|nr:cupin domain-containing protein [Gemmatimonadales bacterium]